MGALQVSSDRTNAAASLAETVNRADPDRPPPPAPPLPVLIKVQDVAEGTRLYRDWTDRSGGHIVVDWKKRVVVAIIGDRYPERDTLDKALPQILAALQISPEEGRYKILHPS